MNPIDLRQRLRSLLAPSVEHMGFDLVAIEWVGGQRGPILRLSIDAPCGINAEDCAAVSEAVSPVLDEDDPIASAYTLEVSSPGMARPVQRRSDFERFEGYRIKIKLVEGHPRRRYTGILAGVDGDEVRVVVDGTEHSIVLDTIERANLALDLEQYQQLAEGKRDDDQ